MKKSDPGCGGYQPVLQRVSALLENAEGPVLVSVDGRCGSGKTTLARLLAGAFPCNVLHTDDYYLPLPARAQNWRQTPAGNMDLQRLAAEVLRPALAGQPITCRPYSCAQKAYGTPYVLAPQPLTVVEGSYAQHPLFAGYYALNIFLTCTPAEQRRRLQQREGAHFAAFESTWIPMEETYFATCRKTAGEELCLATDGFAPPEER